MFKSKNSYKFITAILVGLTFLVLLVVGCSKNIKEKEGEGLKYLRSISTNEFNNLMKYPIDLEYDGDNSLYISDNHTSQIFHFNISGQLVNIIGKKGRGPGEFNMQRGIYFYNQQLFVEDQLNRRLQIFNKGGSLEKTIIKKNSFYSFAVYNDTLFALSVDPFRPLDKSYNQGLIKVYDLSGTKITSFGNFLDFGKDDMTQIGSVSKMKIFDDKLYVLFQYFPLMHVYNLDGRLLKEIMFDELKFDQIKKKSNSFKSRNRIEIQYLYKSFLVDSSGIYLALFKDYLQINRYETDGEYIKSYVYKDVSKSYSIQDFVIIDSGENDRHLYVLNIDGYSVIHVFEMIE